jgi:hypothetical protein
MEKLSKLIVSKGWFNFKRKEVEDFLKPVEGEVRLFRTVLDNAFVDLLRSPKGSPLYEGSYEFFFSKESEPDLSLLCDLAFIDLEKVQKDAKVALENPEEIIKRIENTP